MVQSFRGGFCSAGFYWGCPDFPRHEKQVAAAEIFDDKKEGFESLCDNGKAGCGNGKPYEIAHRETRDVSGAARVPCDMPRAMTAAIPGPGEITMTN